MPDERIGATDVTKLGESDLGNNSAKLTRSGRDTMCGGTVTSGENLSWNDECGDVGAEVLEEVRQTVKEDEGLPSCTGGDKLVIPKAHANKKGGEDGETHKLNRLASPNVDE